MGSVSEILKHKDKSKDKAMYEAYLQYSCTLKDIAEYNDKTRGRFVVRPGLGRDN